ncbi:hypothetical protein FACS189432_06120 [Bacteroidia bacterium]|nr:hypothetical protein FACS189426_18140 [Bacteroidia bacterium]GHT28330.1 hypothetical protein FACS189432_06120 [Bacteroidia bacterium]
MKKVVFLIAIIIAIVNGAALKAQVTIGSNVPPNPGSLLDLKTNNNGGASANAAGGIIFPRVSITNINPTTPEELAASIGGTGSWDLQTHIGLVVYNVNLGAPGLHIWDGNEWIKFAASTALPLVEAGNGLSKNASTAAIELGGNLSKNTEINMSGNTFGITTGTNKLDISGALETDDLYLTEVQSTKGSSTTLVWNEETKKVEKSIVETAMLLFFQSQTETTFMSGTVGENIYIVPWIDAPIASGGDRETNNIMDFISSENSFELRDDANVEVSGYAGYAGTSSGSDGASAGAGYSIIVNLSIEVKRKGAGDWEMFSSVRGVYYESMAAYRNTLSIPPAMLMGNKGDRIRMKLHIKPSGLGVNHSHPRIVIPFGTKFSKSIKIIAQ